MDGDARGGAALSIRHVTGKPIKFIGVGEKTDQLEQFYPDRIASQILGMGDVLSLIEKTEASFNEETAKRMQKKIKRGFLQPEGFKRTANADKKYGTT